ncbi:MAG: TetR/AcrR family transcriptional regulator [Lachnospiraceae bacterium]|nr:TetR/AcrR family transcriptional regulator [Lachnospiraceae bacterium]MBQ7706344.1 TetR/AcrR family transcriptional regulator [Lachnospiraceae bacterium]
MKNNIEYEKRTLLIEAAKKEFREKGYNKASLRSICAKAGVTTGALYFFFENKAELFSAIVDEPVKGLKKMLIEHFKEDREYMEHLDSFENMEMDHSDLSDMLVEYLYKYYDSFILLLTASENTVYVNCIDEIVKLTETAMPVMLSGLKGYTYDEYMSHWMSHITVDAFVNVIKHETDVEQAKIKLRKIMNYLIEGWVQLVFVPLK